MMSPEIAEGRPRCGVLGLGTIGTAMAHRLVRAGHAVCGYDVDAQRVGALMADGVAAARSPREVAARADVVLLALPDTSHILDALDGPDGLADALAPGSALIIASTVTPDTPREVARRLAARGVDVLDAPVSGGPVAALDGSLTIMVGADDAVFARHRALLETLGSHVVHVGPVGDGEVVKLVNNLMGAVIAIGAAEGLALAAKAGVDVARTLDAVSGGSGASWILREWIPRTVLEDRSQTHFAIDLMCKDLDLVRRLAQESGVPVAAAELAGSTFARLRSDGYGAADFSILAAVQAEAAGTTLPERLADGRRDGHASAGTSSAGTT